jgi:RNA polymerase sigma factor (sigma-70 family)
VSAVAARDAGSRVAELFDAHARMVLGVCRVILRDPVEAEDAAQQTFLSAYRSLLGGTAPREPAGWLATIARNECRARLKSREPVLALVDGAAARETSDLAEERERIDVLTAAIAGLPERQRQAVVMRDLRGLSYAELADVLDVPPGAAEALVGRGRRRVRAVFRRARPSVAVIPASLRDDLARLIPHFETATAAAGGAGIVGAGAAKLAVGVAAVAVAVGGSVEVERPVVTPEAAHAAPKVAKRHVRTHRLSKPIVHAAPAVARPERRHSSEGPGSGSDDRRSKSGPGAGSGDLTSNSGHGSGSNELTSDSGPGSGSESPTSNSGPGSFSSGSESGSDPPAVDESGEGSSSDQESHDDGGGGDGSNSGPG